MAACVSLYIVWLCLCACICKIIWIYNCIYTHDKKYKQTQTHTYMCLRVCLLYVWCLCVYCMCGAYVPVCVCTPLMLWFVCTIHGTQSLEITWGSMWCLNSTCMFPPSISFPLWQSRVEWELNASANQTQLPATHTSHALLYILHWHFYYYFMTVKLKSNSCCDGVEGGASTHPAVGKSRTHCYVLITLHFVNPLGNAISREHSHYLAY